MTLPLCVLPSMALHGTLALTTPVQPRSFRALDNGATGGTYPCSHPCSPCTANGSGRFARRCSATRGLRPCGMACRRDHRALVVRSSWGEDPKRKSDSLDRVQGQANLSQGSVRSAPLPKGGGVDEQLLQYQWQQYDEAVQSMDLERALDLLNVLNRFESEQAAKRNILAVSLPPGNLSAELPDRLSQSEASPSTPASPAGTSSAAAATLASTTSESAAIGSNGSPVYAQAAESRESSSSSPSEEGMETNRRLPAGAGSGPRSDSGLPVVEVLGNEAALSLPLETQMRYLKILDTGLAAEDMRLVSRTYDWLQAQGLLRVFGRVKPSDSNVPRLVTPAVLKELAGVEASKLSPKKWGSNSLAPLLGIAGISALVNNGVDVRPILAVALGAAAVDALLLGGTGFGQLLRQWKPYRRRVLVHEAGHVVAAYLLGCPVRGVILDPSQAIKMGIQGQAGTQFWDLTLEEELKQGRLTGASIDRYCVVLFAGVAAEALVYGEAQGGESDENLFKAVLGQLQPAWSPAKVSNQARWAVLQAYLLLKKHRRAHEMVVEGLERGASMGDLARAIEDSMVASA